MNGMWLVSYIILWILFLVVAFVLLTVLRNLGVIYESLSTIQQKSPATNLLPTQDLPDVKLQTLSGKSTAISKFSGIKTAISVISPSCGPCKNLLRNIAAGDWQLDPIDQSVNQAVIISIGEAVKTDELIREINLPQTIPVLIDTDSAILKAWGITTTPVTVIVDEQSKVIRQVIGLQGGV